MNGIELHDREHFAAIREHRETNDGMAMVLPCYRAPGMLESQRSAQQNKTLKVEPFTTMQGGETP